MKKPVSKNNQDLTKPAVLGDPYQSIESEQIDQRSKNSISEAHLVNNTEKNEKFIRLLNRFKAFGNNVQTQRGYNIYRGDSLSKLIEILRRFARKLGWKTAELTDDALEAQAEKISEEFEKQNMTIADLTEQLHQVNEEKTKYLQEVQLKHEQEIEKLMKDTQRLEKLSSDLNEFKVLISDFEKNNCKEEDVQKFLEGKKWFFGTNIVSAKPKTRAGSTTIFDFILTYTDGSQRIVELKLPTEKILDSEGKLAAPVTKGLDQLIDYLKQTVAIAHTQLPETEYIKEKKPKGTLLIGRTTNDETKEKIKSWNYALHLVEIKTYDTLIADAETAIKQLKGEISEMQ